MLCNYARVGDPSRETMDMLEVGEVMKWVAGLVTPATVVTVENVMEAFSATYWSNLVSLLFLFISSFCLRPLILLVSSS